MKGIAFRAMEYVVTARGGEAEWDALLQDAGGSGVYTTLREYPDVEIGALVRVAAARWHLSRTATLHRLGRAAMPWVIGHWPRFFEPYHSVFTYLRAHNSIVQYAARRLYPGGECPQLDCTDAPGGGLLVRYASPRGLCMLVQGLLEGAADHYGERIRVEHLRCVHRGDEGCLLRVTALQPRVPTGMAKSGATAADGGP